MNDAKQTTIEPRWPRTLEELAAACDEAIRLFHTDWVRTIDLSGDESSRDARHLRAMIEQGFVEGKKWGTSKQAQWGWRITDAGREALRVR